MLLSKRRKGEAKEEEKKNKGDNYMK